MLRWLKNSLVAGGEGRVGVVLGFLFLRDWQFTAAVVQDFHWLFPG